MSKKLLVISLAGAFMLMFTFGTIGALSQETPTSSVGDTTSTVQGTATGTADDAYAVGGVSTGGTSSLPSTGAMIAVAAIGLAATGAGFIAMKKR